ncbi:MAG: MOSC domain-containing protein [Cyclobacteriaceae bacterium]|jgi:hypothetical protein|nr:MOSC domain-containing protein [Cyclobacteriaceae bacterium]
MKQLTEIWIYPIKSLGGIRLPSSRVLPKGLEHDRRWMLIDENQDFLTQRTLPTLALFRLERQHGQLKIHHQGESRLLPGQPAGTERLRTHVWDDEVFVREVDPSLSHWFSGILGQTVRLVAFPEDEARPVDPRYAQAHEHVSLADGYPFLIVGESSLRDLNSRLKVPVPMNRFRPNLVFSGGEPYEEDGWSTFAIGQNRFKGVKPCARCIMTTIDQATAEVGKEPLATLASYRKRDHKIYFGQNVMAVDTHEIREGDEISC